MTSKGAKTRARIRSEAYRLFAEKSFKEVTMSDICERTGLSRGGVYRYYSGTSEIFSEILTEEPTITDRMEHKESAAAILEDLLDTVKKEIQNQEPSLSLAIYEYANLGHKDFFTHLNDNAKKRWISLIHYGMETGEFQTVNPGQIAELILYYYQGLRMWSRVIPFGTDEAESYADTIRQLLLKD